MLLEEDPFSVPKNVHFWEKHSKGVVRDPLEGCILLEEECLSSPHNSILRYSALSRSPVYQGERKLVGLFHPFGPIG